MIRSKKKLALQLETIAQLDAQALQQVQGGRRSQCSYEYSGCVKTSGREEMTDPVPAPE